jgi:hypothetical protein
MAGAVMFSAAKPIAAIESLFIVMSPCSDLVRLENENADWRA